ncbi:hypothetical protein ABFS83_12G019800 [Erythranthe nasuta]
MGNCQAAEAATVVIQHPAGGKVERIYWSVSANEVMNSNPGHYVALVVASPASARRSKDSGAAAVKQQLKLLRPDDTLVLGQVYRLISFEDVLKEFAAKRCVKLGKLLKERNQAGRRLSSAKVEHDEVQHSLGSGGDGGGSSGGIPRHQGGGGGQWRPALQSISEIET